MNNLADFPENISDVGFLILISVGGAYKNLKNGIKWKIRTVQVSV